MVWRKHTPTADAQRVPFSLLLRTLRWLQSGNCCGWLGTTSRCGRWGQQSRCGGADCRPCQKWPRQTWPCLTYLRPVLFWDNLNNVLKVNGKHSCYPPVYAQHGRILGQVTVTSSNIQNADSSSLSLLASQSFVLFWRRHLSKSSESTWPRRSQRLYRRLLWQFQAALSPSLWAHLLNVLIILFMITILMILLQT